MTGTSSAGQPAIREEIKEMRLSLNRLENSLAVHTESHKAIDTDAIRTSALLGQFSVTLNGDGDKKVGLNGRMSIVENDLQRLTANLNKLVWAVVTPLIAMIVGGLIYIVSIPK
jgi:hypothetical protein